MQNNQSFFDQKQLIPTKIHSAMQKNSRMHASWLSNIKKIALYFAPIFCRNAYTIFQLWDMLFSLVMGIGLEAYPLAPFLASVPRGICSYFGGNACNITVS